MMIEMHDQNVIILILRYSEFNKDLKLLKLEP